MFYSDHILCKKGPLAVIWLAAHWERKLTKQQITTTDIAASIQELDQMPPMALRLKGQLLLGMSRIYGKKAIYLMDDCKEAIDDILGKEESPKPNPQHPALEQSSHLLLDLTTRPNVNAPFNSPLIPVIYSQTGPPKQPHIPTDVSYQPITFDPSEFPEWEFLTSYDQLSQPSKKQRTEDTDAAIVPSYDYELPLRDGSPPIQEIEKARREAPGQEQISDMLIEDQLFADLPSIIQEDPKVIDLPPIPDLESHVALPPTSPESPLVPKTRDFQRQRRVQRRTPNGLLLDQITELSGRDIQAQLKDPQGVTIQPLFSFSRTTPSSFWGLFSGHPKNEFLAPNLVKPNNLLHEESMAMDPFMNELPLQDFEPIAGPNVLQENNDAAPVKMEDDVQMSNLTTNSNMVDFTSKEDDIMEYIQKETITFGALIHKASDGSFVSWSREKKRHFVSTSFLSILDRASKDSKFILTQPSGAYGDIFIQC